ncbi:HAD family hydrolase [Spirochaetota bacterium]
MKNNKGDDIMKFKAVIFDLDGTLLDTLGDIAISTNAALKNRGYAEHDVSKYRGFVGDGMDMLARRVLPGDIDDESVILEFIKEVKEEYTNGWKNTSDLYPGIKNMLNMLKERGIKKSVLSNKPHDFTVAHVEYFLSHWDFEVVSGVKKGIPRKPDPSGAIEISKAMSIAPKEFIYVGDTKTDMKTAVGAGMFPVGVLWGFRDEDELRENGAKEIIKRPEDLLDFI